MSNLWSDQFHNSSSPRPVLLSYRVFVRNRFSWYCSGFLVLTGGEAGLASPGLTWGRFLLVLPRSCFFNVWRNNLSLYHYMFHISLDITINYYVRGALGVYSPFSYCNDSPPITGLFDYHIWLTHWLTYFLLSILRPKLPWDQLNLKEKWNEPLKTVLFEFSMFTTSYYISMYE